MLLVIKLFPRVTFGIQMSKGGFLHGFKKIDSAHVKIVTMFQCLKLLFQLFLNCLKLETMFQRIVFNIAYTCMYFAAMLFINIWYCQLGMPA